MGWIKRNLFFVLGGIVSLGLLGGASVYVYQNWSKNSAIYNQLAEVIGSLQTLAQQKPAPGNEKINNTALAKDQTRQLQEWNKSVRGYFQPIEGIPAETPVASEAYAASLRRTLDQLQHEANDAGVLVPKDFDFSFTAQRPLVKFAGSLEPLAVQLGEVKTLAEVLFSARVYALDGIQRVRVSPDDNKGPQSDYLVQPCVTNNLATLTPYAVSFRCFTPELAQVISRLVVSSNAFIIKSVNVQSAGAVATPAATAGAAGALPPAAPPPLVDAAVAPPAPVDKGGLQTALKEQLLRVTLELRLVKLLSKS